MNSKIAVTGRGKVGIKRYINDGQAAATTNVNSKYPNTKSDTEKNRPKKSAVIG